MNEALENAIQDMKGVIANLRMALNKAGSVEGIVVLALNKQANELQQSLENLFDAYKSDVNY